ncbi:hemerythrin domain-containing protein [Hydrogenophaga sp.]|uniref:hemerythrin domain-containing protein n=1 Tax=Hydrogenophaga sp. TaxID=1904254 RepID=UPI003D1217AA
MHTHALEMAHVVATTRTGEGRFNPYAGIHKALRAFMADTLMRVGRTDPFDDGEVTATVAQVVELMDLCAGHVEHENRFVHPALEARCPGVAGPVAQDHEDHRHHIAHLRGVAQALTSGDAAQRGAALHALYLGLGLFLADNLRHMHVEETVHNPALWSAYSDAELIAIHDEIVAALPSGEMMLVMRWMMPQLNAPERLEALQGMRAGAPAPVFEGMLDALRGLLPQGDWAKLARGLGVPVVPALMSA